MEEFKSRFDVAALAESMADTIRADAEAWENNTLGSFLSGLSGWLEDMHGYYEARGEVGRCEDAPGNVVRCRWCAS